MVISDFKFPDHVPYMLTGDKTYMQCGYRYGYTDNGTFTRYYTSTIQSYDLIDKMIQPTSADHYAETDWFNVFHFPNGYHMKMRFIVHTNRYLTMEWSLADEQDNLFNPAGNIPGFTGGRGSGNQLQENLYNLQNGAVKVGFFTTFPNNPVSGSAASGFVFMVVFGQKDVLYFPSNSYIDEPENTTPKVIKFKYRQDLFGVSSFEDFDTYLRSHGNPVPADMPTFPDDIPNSYDPSKPGGGDGNYNDDSDPIDFPVNSTGGAMTCGAVHAFHVQPTTIQQIFQKLWSTNIFDYATWQKLVQNPLDCIVSLHALPITPTTGTNPENIFIGNFDTELTSPVITSQWNSITCGKLHLNKFFGTAMDYSEYTRIQIYLPFSGIHDLAPEDVQGSDIEVKYNIDVLTGDCVINVKCGISVLYKFTGNMKMGIPITARDSSLLGAGLTGVAGTIGGAIKGAAAGGVAGAVAGGVTQGVLTTAASVATRRVNVSRSGNITGSLGLMDEFRPYLIIHRPQQSLATDYNKFKGYPSNLTRVLSSCSGYTEVQHVHLTGISGATDTELNEIEQMLKAGVII